MTLKIAQKKDIFSRFYLGLSLGSLSWLYATSYKIDALDLSDDGVLKDIILDKTIFSTEVLREYGLDLKNEVGQEIDNLAYLNVHSNQNSLTAHDPIIILSNPSRHVLMKVSSQSDANKLEDSYQIDSPITITNSDTTLSITLYGNQHLTLSSGLTGAGAILKKGQGFLVLDGNSSNFDGNIIIDSGSIVLEGESQINGTAYLTSNNSSLNVKGIYTASSLYNDGEVVLQNESGSREDLFSVIGVGSLIKRGQGDISLKSPQKYSGGTIVESGRLILNEKSLQGMIENQDQLEVNVNNISISYDQTLINSGTLIKSGSQSLELLGQVNSTGLSIIEEGELIVHSSSFDGNYDNQGVLRIKNDTEYHFENNLTGEGLLIIEGQAPLFLSGSINQTGPIINNNSALTINANNLAASSFESQGETTLNLSENTVYAGEIKGEGDWIKTGSGTLGLSGENTATGDILISQGAINFINQNIIIQDIINHSEVIFTQTNNDAESYGHISGDGILTKKGTGNLFLLGKMTLSGGINIEGGSILVNENSFQGNFHNDGSINIDLDVDDLSGHDSFSYDGVISGSGSVRKIGLKNLTINNRQTYTGDTFIEEGVLTYGDDHILSDQSLVNISEGAVFNLNGHQDHIRTIRGAGTIDLGTGGELTIDDHSISSFSGIIRGNSSLKKIGSGELTLAGENIYTGGTKIHGGTFIIENGAHFQGDLELIEGTSVTMKTGSIYDLTDGHQILVGFDGLLSLKGTINHDGHIEFGVPSLAASGGQIEFDGVSFKNETSSLSVLDPENSSNYPTILIKSGGVVFDVGQDSTTTFNLAANGNIFSKFNKIGQGDLFLTATGGHLGDLSVESGSVIVSGVDGSLINSNIQIDQGSTLKFQEQSSLNVVNNISINHDDGLIFDHAFIKNQSNSHQSYTITSNNSILLSAAGITIDTNFGDLIIEGGTKNLGSEHGSLNKASQGLLVLAGDLDHDGITRIQDGALQFVNNLPKSHLIISGTAIFDHGIDLSTSIEVSGSGNFIKKNGGSLTIESDLSFDGFTQIDQGKLIFKDSMTHSSLIKNNSLLELNYDGNKNFSSNIDGGFLIKKGVGLSILSGEKIAVEKLEIDLGSVEILKEFQSPLTLVTNDTHLKFSENSSILVNRNSTMTNNGEVVFSGGLLKTQASLTELTFTQTGNNLLLDEKGIVINTSEKNLTINASFSGHNGLLKKTGNNTLILNQTSDYTGTTIIEQGAIKLVNSTLSSSITNSSTLEIMNDSNHDLEFLIQLSGSGTLIKSGSGITVLNGNQNYTGQTQVSAGTLNIKNNFYSTNLSTAAGSALQLTNNDYHAANNITLVNSGLTIIDNSKVIYDKSDGTTLLITGSGNAISISSQELVFDSKDKVIECNVGFSNYQSQEGVIRKKSSGTLILKGSNTYTGLTIIEDGKITLDNTILSGDVSNSSKIEFLVDANTSKNFQKTVTGSGDLFKTGEGSLLFSKDQSYIGTTHVYEGTLNVYKDLQSRFIEVDQNSLLEFKDQSSLSPEHDVSIINRGRVNFDGVTFNQNSNSTYQIQDAIDSLPIELTSKGVTFQINAGELDVESDFKNNTGQNGILRKKGNGILVLKGTLTNTGTTFVDEGSLVLQDTVSGGLINVTSELSFNNSVNKTQAAVIAGAGSVLKKGSGILTLTNTNTHTGAIRIDQGLLKLEGSMTSSSYETLIGTEFSLMNNSQLSLNTNTSFINNGAINANGVTIKSSSGAKSLSITGSKKVELLSNGLIIDTAQGDITINGGLTDTSSQGLLRKIGTGSFYLNQDSDYRGKTQITSGNMIVNGGFQSSTWDVSLNGLLKLSSTSEVVVDQSTISNSGKILIDGALIKTGDESSAGSFTLTQGNSFKVTANGLKVETQTKDMVWNAPLVDEVNQQGVFLKKGQHQLTVNSLIDLSGSLTVDSGSLVLSSILVHPEIAVRSGASVSFADNAIFKLSKSSQTISNDGQIIFDGGILSNETSTTERILGASGGIEVSSKGIIVDTALGGIKITSAISNYQSEQGTITKKSSGTLTLTGNLLSTGDIDLQAGTIYLLDTMPVASIKNNSILIADLTQNNQLSYNKTITGTGTFLKKGTGELTFNQPNQFTGQTTLNNGIININNIYTSALTIESNGVLKIQNQGDLTGNIINNSSQERGLIFDHAANKTYTKNISGTGHFYKDGAGVLNFTGHHTSSGSSVIANGTLLIDSGADWNGSIELTSAQSRLELNTSSQLNLANTQSLKFSNGAQALIKGKISISDAIYVGSDSLIPDAKILINGGVIENSTTRLSTINPLSQNVKIQIDQNGLIINGSNSLADIKLNTSLTGSGALTKTGTQKLTFNTSTDHFQTNIQAGSFELLDGHTMYHQLSVASSASAYIYGQYLPTAAEVISVDGLIYFYTPQGSSRTLNGKINGAASGIVTLESGGQVNYQGDASSFSGLMYVKNTELITSSSSILAGSLKVDVGAVLELKGVYQGSNSFNIENKGTFKIENTSGVSVKSIESPVQSTGDIIKNGSGQFSFVKYVDHSGDLSINQGSLKIIDRMTFGKLNATKTLALTNNQSILNLGAGSNFDIRGSFNQTGNGYLFFDQALITVNGNIGNQLIVNTATASEIAQELEANIDLDKYLIWHGAFSDHLGSNAMIKKTGLGTLVLDGAQTYTGSTQIDAGLLIVETGTSFQSNLINNASLKLLTSISYKTIPQNISGTGSLIKEGAGVLDLSGQLTYQGNTTIQSGRLEISGSMSTGNSSSWSILTGASLFFKDSELILKKNLTLDQGIVLFDGATIIGNIPADGATAATFHSGAVTGANKSRLSIESNGLTIRTEDSSIDISLPISGAGGLVKTGSKKLTLSGPSTSYQGDTLISNGTLEIMESFDSLSNIQNNATLMFSNRTQSSFELTQNITGTGGVIAQQGETILSGDEVSYEGTSNVVHGARLVLKDSFTGSGDFELAGTLAVITNEPRTLVNNLRGNGTFQKYGSSSLTIDQFMGNFTGVTEIYEGHLEVNGSLSGVVRIYGSATYSGEITIDDSSQSVIEGIFNGTVLNNNNLLYVGNSYLNQSISAKINGVGTLIKVGKNRLALAGADHTYTGHFLIQNGLMSLNADFNRVADTIVESGAVLKVMQGSNLSGVTKINAGSFLHIDSKLNEKESDLTHVINQGFMIVGSAATSIDQQNNSFQDQVQVKIGALELADNSKLILRVSKESQPNPRPLLQLDQISDLGGRILLKTQGFGADFKNQEYKLITGLAVEKLQEISSKIEVPAMFDASFFIKDNALCVNLSKKSSDEAMKELISKGAQSFVRQIQSDQIISKTARLVELTQLIDQAETKKDLAVIANQLTPDISHYKNLTNLYLQKNLNLMNSLETQLAVGQNFIGSHDNLSNKKLIKRILLDMNKTKSKIANHEKSRDQDLDWMSLNKTGLSVMTQGYRVDSELKDHDHELGSVMTSYGFQALVSHRNHDQHVFKLWTGLNHSDYKVLFNIAGKAASGHLNDRSIGLGYGYRINDFLEVDSGLSLGSHQMEYQRSWISYHMDNDNLNIIPTMLEAQSNAAAHDVLFSLKIIGSKKLIGTTFKPYAEMKWNNFYRKAYQEQAIDIETQEISSEGNNVLENTLYSQIASVGFTTYTSFFKKNSMIDLFQNFSLSRISYSQEIGTHRFQYQFDESEQVFEVPYDQKPYYVGLYAVGLIYRLNEFMSFGINYEVEKSYYQINRKVLFSGELAF